MVSREPTVREETPDDVDRVREVVTAAFGGDRVAGLLDEMRTSVAWLDLSFVAEERGKVVAAVCYARGWLDAPARLVDVLVLSPLAVVPDRQRAGIGSTLVRESLRRLAPRSEPLVFVEGAPGYYSRLGFVAAHELGFTSPSVRIPRMAFQVATLPGYDQGKMSGALVYPDVFWRHDCVGVRPERG